MADQDHLKLYFLLIAGTEGMLLIAVGIILFVAVYQKRVALQHQEKQELSLNYQRQLNENNIRATEAERRRIAADLHDEVGHALLTLRLQLHRWENGNESLGLIDHTLGTVRRISYDLFPPGLETFGIGHELGELFLQAEKSGVLVEQEIETEERPSPETELALYRIVQELLSNTLRYSQASVIYFRMNRHENSFHAEYADNGSGFELPQVKRGFGLLNIENRIHAAGGTLSMHTAAGKGFRIQMQFPFKNGTNQTP